jgi:putative tricarboxylic transport membrane protein
MLRPGDHERRDNTFTGAPRRLHMTTRFGQDVGAGLMFAVFGALGLWLARDYAVGTALRMEPGYVPRLLCWGMIGIGVLIAARGFIAGGAAIPRWHWRPLLFVLGALIAFRYLVEPAGLPIATFVTVVIAALGSREVRLVDTLLLAVGLAIAAVALFIFALGLPMTLWPF